MDNFRFGSLFFYDRCLLDSLFRDLIIYLINLVYTLFGSF